MLRDSHDGEIARDVPRVDRRDRALNQSHALLRHRLPPLLGEAFGGSTSLVDVGVVVNRTRRPSGDQ
jgi:hypothetical protein